MKKPEKIVHPLEILDIKKVLALDETKVIRAVFFTGRRLKEVTSLKWPMMNIENMTYMYMTHGYDSYGVIKETKEAPMSSLFRNLLMEIGPKKTGLVFPKWKGRERYISKKFQDLCTKAGVRHVKLMQTQQKYMVNVAIPIHYGITSIMNKEKFESELWIESELITRKKDLK